MRLGPSTTGALSFPSSLTTSRPLLASTTTSDTSIPTSHSQPADNDDNDDNFSGYALALVILGALVGVSLVLIGGCVIWSRAKSSRALDRSPERKAKHRRKGTSRVEAWVISQAHVGKAKVDVWVSELHGHCRPHELVGTPVKDRPHELPV